ncbi:hypothetical protein Tco_1213313 [Tanacetum coccineum]
MGDEHLNTIPETESDEVIKSSVKNLVPIPSQSEVTFDNMCDVPFCDKNHFDDELDLMESLINQETSIIHYPKIYSLLEDDDDSFEDIDYVEASPPVSELVSLEEVKDFDTKDEDIDTNILLTIKDDILHGKLRNINLLIAKIKSLNDNPTLDFVLKSPSLFPILVKGSDFFLENTEIFLSSPELEILDLILKIRIVADCPDFEGSRARCFVHRSLALQSLACLYWESDILNLIN